jgi:hypothetical protein
MSHAYRQKSDHLQFPKQMKAILWAVAKWVQPYKKCKLLLTSSVGVFKRSVSAWRQSQTSKTSGVLELEGNRPQSEGREPETQLQLHKRQLKMARIKRLDKIIQDSYFWRGGEQTPGRERLDHVHQVHHCSPRCDTHIPSVKCLLPTDEILRRYYENGAQHVGPVKVAIEKVLNHTVGSQNTASGDQHPLPYLPMKEWAQSVKVKLTLKCYFPKESYMNSYSVLYSTLERLHIRVPQGTTNTTNCRTLKTTWKIIINLRA